VPPLDKLQRYPDYQKAPCEATRDVDCYHMMPTRYNAPGLMIDAKSLVTDHQMDNATNRLRVKPFLKCELQSYDAIAPHDPVVCMYASSINLVPRSSNSRMRLVMLQSQS